MAAVIRSTTLNAGGKILRKSQRSTEVDGLVTLVETYTIRTADIESIEPDRNTGHSSFSTASQTYPRMQVETTRIDPMDGDLSELVVTYVGLDYLTGLPPAFITTVGQPGAGVFGADASIVVRYLTADSLFATLKGGGISISAGGSQLALPTKRLLPSSINGTVMPPNPRPREFRRSKTVAEAQAAATAAFNKDYMKNKSVGIGSIIQGPIVTFSPNYEWIYAGYVQTGISFQRRGLFNQIEEQFTEYFRGSDIFYTADGVIDLNKVLAFSDINATF
jgi:hypothetical protein